MTERQKDKKIKSKTDRLFAQPDPVTPFSFDKRVAEVFPDMIKRSVPGYPVIIRHIEKLAARFVQNDSVCFDLGCSLGAASLAMSSGIQSARARIIAVDNSPDMLARCQQHIDAFKHSTPIELQLADIAQISINNASMVVLNFTLQFIPRAERQQLLRKIYHGLNPGGILVLSEKIFFEDPHINDLMIDLHYEFKKENGYSDLEISQKRNSLENVLVPDSLEFHLERLKSIGFSSANCWIQQFNFMSLIAIK
jgi:tRNA (cmo5U34)-methyltransferase